MLTQIMFDNGSAGAAKKPTTNFTIECILSKDSIPKEPTNSQQHLLMLNKVLDNPWIPKTPLALSFNPSCYHRKVNFSGIPFTPTYDYLTTIPTTPLPTTTSDFIQNLVKTTQNHTSIHNHFYSIPKNNNSLSVRSSQLMHMKNVPTVNASDTAIEISTSNSSYSSLAVGKIQNISKINVYESNKLCDNQLLSEDAQNVVDNTRSSLVPCNENKCSVCFKVFENSDSMDVSLKHVREKDF